MSLTDDYPWTVSPLVAAAPMRLIATAPLTVEVTKAGGIGFLGSGNDLSTLEAYLQECAELLKDSKIGSQGQNGSSGKAPLPVGVGFLNWGAPLDQAISILKKYPPAAVWFFAPHETQDLRKWSEAVRTQVQPTPKIWIQVASVAETRIACEQDPPDVLVIQGQDAGGHGLSQSAGLISLLPEVADYLKDAEKAGKISKVPKLVAAGGIMDGRGLAASLALGAEGVVLGTLYLASEEARLAKGYQQEILRASDGGQNTIRTNVYDYLRGTTDWPKRYGGRGVINESFTDWTKGMDKEENRRKYEESIKLGDAGWGPSGRMTTYAGTGIGLVKEVKPAGVMTDNIRKHTRDVLSKLGSHQA